ncbi:MAG: biotin--[acetyl-CoA-carboxylase] ligase [Nitrososphaerales archaeon]
MQESLINDKQLKILKLLKRAGGNQVSGETISRNVKVSRAAIWKYVSLLRRYGYSIVSKQGSGYRLARPTEQLLPWEVEDGLTTEFVGRDIRHFSVLDSTQDVAIRLAEGGASEGMIVLAERQRRGRARVGRRWIAPEGGIWFSIILRPKLLPAESTILPLMGALAICNPMRQEYRLDARLKWPNDVIIRGRKVSGILAEMSCEADRINYIVMGIGVNANNSSRRVEKTVKGTEGYYGVTSLMDELGAKVDRAALVRRILAEFEDLYTDLGARGADRIISSWKERSATLGMTVTVAFNEMCFEGKAIDLDYDGALLVKLPDGDIKRVLAGDVYVRLLKSKKARR